MGHLQTSIDIRWLKKSLLTFSDYNIFFYNENYRENANNIVVHIPNFQFSARSSLLFLTHSFSLL